MSWVSEYNYTWYETLAMNIIRSGGHLPRHIAFVMDGNRRYAQSEQLRKIDGHARGFVKLSNCLRWCLDIGIREVTTFAFSIENFKRSEEEVNGLFDLAREKFLKILEDPPELDELGLCIRVIGSTDLLPLDLQQLIAKAMLRTESNDKLFLNIAFSYTSRDEITQAVECVLKYGADSDLQLDDIGERLLEGCLYTRQSPPPDLLFRTSGETRISDFLMWQMKTTVLYFSKILWPQITLWNFLTGIFAYQRASLRIEPFRKFERLEHVDAAKSTNYFSERVRNFLQRIDLYRKNVLLSLSSTKQSSIAQTQKI